MCQSPYLMKWTHTKKHCPNLVRDVESDTGVPVWTKWGKIYERSWQSLAHVWSEFNGEYEKADFPRLIVRFEGKLLREPGFWIGFVAPTISALATVAHAFLFFSWFP
jgi:hypothetical protein